MDATVLRVTALCVAAAMICAVLRLRHPEQATALSLAVGVGVLALLASELAPALERLEGLRQLFDRDGQMLTALLKAAGIAIIAELGAQLCADAGESALAGRVALAARVAILGVCAPMLAEALERITGLLSW